MSTEKDIEREIAAEIVAAAREALGRRDIISTRIIVLAESLEPDGSTAIWSAADTDLKPWQTMGMLEFLKYREVVLMTKMELEDEDD